MSKPTTTKPKATYAPNTSTPLKNVSKTGTPKTSATTPKPATTPKATVVPKQTTRPATTSPAKPVTAPSAQKSTVPVLAPGGKGQAQVQFKPDGTYQLVRKPSTSSAQSARSTPSTSNASPSTGKTVPNTGHGSAGNAGGGNGVIDAVGKFASGFGSALKDNVEGIINLPQTIWNLMQTYGDTVYYEYQQHIAKGGTAETFNTASPAGTLGKAIGKSAYVETRQSVQAIMDGDAGELGRFAGDIAFAVATGAAAKGVGVVGKRAALSDEAVALSKSVQRGVGATQQLGKVIEVVDNVCELYRKASNTGDFKDLKELMQLKHVKNVADKAGVGLDGIKVKIDSNPELLGKGVCGFTDGKTITLYPDAFADTETLVKTIAHERIHVYQVDVFGRATSSEMLGEFERAAFGSENSWWDYYKSKNRGEV